jgi:hypothetical protein
VVGIEGGAVSGVIHLESSGLVRRTADYVMKSITWKSDSSQPAAETAVYLFDDRLVRSFEAGVRDRAGDEFIQKPLDGAYWAFLKHRR